MQRRAALEVVFFGRLIIRPSGSCLVSPGCYLIMWENEGRRQHAHLLAAEDESLLHGWDAFFLLDALFYLRDLRGWWGCVSALCG